MGKKLRHHIIQSGKNSGASVHQIGYKVLIKTGEYGKIFSQRCDRVDDGPGVRRTVHSIFDANKPRAAFRQHSDKVSIHITSGSGREVIDKPVTGKFTVKTAEIAK